MQVGTWDWAQATHGRLRRRDALRLTAQGAIAQLERFPNRVGNRGASLELPPEPDSALALDAEELVRELSPAPLYGHCLRTWAFSALFALRDRVAHDAELLYVACLLHDLGITERHWLNDSTAQCFAVEGARAAHAFVCGHGEPEARARTVAEAISVHMNINVGSDLDPVAQLLGRGVALDAVGRRAGSFDRATLAAVNERWPRDGSGATLSALTLRQAQARPHSRAALMHRLGFARLIAANPLDA